MKICHLADFRSMFIRREVEYLAAKMDEINILTFHAVPADFSKVQNLKIYSLIYSTQNSQNDSSEVAIHIQKKEPVKSIFRFFYSKIPEGMATLLDLEIYAYRARAIIKRIKPDIVHGHFLSHYGYIAARTGFRPLIVTAMGDDVLIRPDDSLLMMWTMLYAAKKADKIRATARAIAEQMIRYGVNAKKIATFPRGVNLDIFRPSGHSGIREKLGWKDKKILIMVRNFYSYICGHEYFILALPKIIHQEPQTRVILVGSGQLEAKFRKMVSKLGLNEYVYFTGEVNEIGVSEYLNAADIYVATSLSDGTSNALLEAMACALPAVVSDAPANLEWVKDGKNGFITPRKNPEVLAKRILLLLGDESLRKKMGEQNVCIVQEQANRDVCFDKLWSIYQNLNHKKKVE